MPISVASYTQFKGFAVAPSDIQLREAETKTLPVLSEEGQLLQAKFVRWGLTIVIRGVRQDEADPFLLQAQQAGLRQFQGSPEKENIALLGRTFYQCVLVDCLISQPIQLQGTSLIEEMTLNYESQVFV